MNFIKLGNMFVNLKAIESFEVFATPGDVAVRFVYTSGRQETAHIYVEDDDTTQIFDIESAEDAVAEAILSAIQNCSDSDCEDIAEYLEV